MNRLPPFCRKADIFVLLLIFLCSLGMALLPLRKQGTQAIVTVSGETVALIDLQRNQPALSVTGAEGFVFSVEDGSIFINSAPCPAGQCCDAPPIASVGQCIICLPAQLTVTVTDDADSFLAPDAVIG